MPANVLHNYGDKLAAPFHTNDLDETEEAVSATPGYIAGWFLHNASSATMFFHFYNATVADVIVGTTTPYFTLPMPTGASANIMFPVDAYVPFNAAITIAATTAFGGTGNPANNEAFATIFFR